MLKKPLCKGCGYHHLVTSPCMKKSLTYIKIQETRLKEKQKSDEKIKKQCKLLR